MEFNENIRRSSRNKINVEPVEANSMKSILISNDSHRIQEPRAALFEDSTNKPFLKDESYDSRNTNWDSCNESGNSAMRSQQSNVGNEFNINNTELDKDIKKEIFFNVTNHILNEDLMKPGENENDVQIENGCKKLYGEQNKILNPESQSKLYITDYLENDNFDITNNRKNNNLESSAFMEAEECDMENLSTEAIHESGSEDSQEYISNYNGEPMEEYVEPNIYEEKTFSNEESHLTNTAFHKIDENIRMIIFGDTEYMNKNILRCDKKTKSIETNSTESCLNGMKNNKSLNDHEHIEIQSIKKEICQTGLEEDIDFDQVENKKIEAIDANGRIQNSCNAFELQGETTIKYSTENLQKKILARGEIERNVKTEVQNEEEVKFEIFENNFYDQNNLENSYFSKQTVIEENDLQNDKKVEVRCQTEMLKEKIIKSADIYFSVEKKLTLHCKLCLERFTDLKLYKEHIYNKHESNKTEANDITDTRFKFLSGSFNMFDYNDGSNIILNENLFKMPIGEIIWVAHLDKFKYQCSTCNNNYDEFDDLLKHENCVRDFVTMNEIENRRSTLKIEEKEPVKLESEIKADTKKVYINDGGRNDERWDKLSFSEIMELINKYIGIPDISLESDDILKLEPRDDLKIPNDKSIDPDYLDEEERKAIFPCQLCGKLYTCRTILREHVRIHTGDKIHQCDVCNKGFLRSKYLDAHKILFHSNPDDTDMPDSSIIRDNISKDMKTYQCRYCERSLSNKSVFEDHLKVHYGVEPFRCQFCKLVFIRKRIQASHEFQIHDDKFLKCGICNRQFDNLTVFQEHKQDHKLLKPEQFFCHYCNEAFPTKQKLTYHTKVHEAGDRFKCLECNKTCGNQYMLDQHSKKHSKNQDGTIKLIKCKECEDIFDNYKDLREHQQIHGHGLHDEADKNVYQCKYCSLSFRAARKLSHHETLHKVGNKFECEHCKKCFGNNFTLQKHLLTHGVKTEDKDDNTIAKKLDEGEFKCKYCGLKFKTPKKVLFHELRHKIGDKFECKFCGKHLTSANSLDQHCRKHLNNVQAFVCSNCPAKFSLKETRDLHETGHSKKAKLCKKRNTNAYAFECNYCVKRFATEKCLEKHTERFHMNLDTYKLKCTYETCTKRFDKERKRSAHERIHIAGEKFKCNFCPKLCYDHNTLKQHLRRHGQETDFKCKFCPATFNFKHTRTLHEKFKHSSTMKPIYKKSFKLKVKTLSKIDYSVIFSCDLCRKSFSSDIILKCHKIKFHEGPKYFECCSKMFKSKLKLRRHQKTHLDKNSFECKICVKSFKTKLFLKLHNNRKHSVIFNSKLEECKLCDLLFEQDEFIKHTNNIHSADKLNPYKCLHCDKKFRTLGLLRVHRLTHINLFKCDFCSAGFRHENLLNQHLVTHRTEKKPNPPPKIIFTCPICQKRFNSLQWKLLAHMEKEHQQQIFRCQEKDYCKRSFLTKAELIEHKKTHLGARIEVSSDDQKPFKCGLCDKKFIYEAFMKSHVNKFHDSLTPKCKICFKKFDNEPDFLKHKPLCVQNKDFKQFQCPYCLEKTFALENLLNTHLHKAHNAELYKCSYCRQSYLKPENLEDHIKNHHIDDLIIKSSEDPRPFKCEFENCNNRFISSVFLNNHLSKVHNMIIYRCEHCKKGYREEKYFKEHKLTHIISLRAGDVAPKVLTKPSMNIITDSSQELPSNKFLSKEKSDILLTLTQDSEKQMKEVSDTAIEIIQPIDIPKKLIDKKSEDESQVLEELFSAVVSDLDFKEDYLEDTSILKHLLRATDENEPSTSQYVPEPLPTETEKQSVSLVESLRTYRKKPCNEQKMINERIRERKQSLEALRPFKCQECDKSFVLDIYLINHVTKVHGSDALANLNLHEARHTAEITAEAIDNVSLEHQLSPEMLKQFECDQCWKLFSNPNLLKVHKKLHAGKPFKCNQCPAEFASQQKYDEHEELHKLQMEGKAVFKCKICEKLFSNNSKLKIHDKSHSVERPFSCDLCPLTFKSKGHFFDHKRSHTGEKPFKCRYCPEKFPRANYRLKHERKHPEFFEDRKQKL